MAIVELRLDLGPDRDVTPLDGELAFAIVDVFYLVCTKEHGPFGDLVPYEAVVETVTYNSPLKIVSKLKNVSVATAKFFGERILFYSEERDKRILTNKGLQQDVTKKALKNLDEARKLRKKLIKDESAPSARRSSA